MSKENVQKVCDALSVDAKAAAVREKLQDESLDKCKVEGGDPGDPSYSAECSGHDNPTFLGK